MDVIQYNETPTQPQNIIVFATEDFCQQWCNDSFICLDGTFNVVPKQFAQLFTIHSFVGEVNKERLVPRVYALPASQDSALLHGVV